MEFLSLTDFICADFMSTVNSQDYPPRECKQADRAWAAAPTVFGAPCCHNATLVVASVAMVSMHEVGSRTEASLEELLAYYHGNRRQLAAGTVAAGTGSASATDTAVATTGKEVPPPGGLMRRQVLFDMESDGGILQVGCSPLLRHLSGCTHERSP